jgi:hypothetical protein
VPRLNIRSWPRPELPLLGPRLNIPGRPGSDLALLTGPRLNIPGRPRAQVTLLTRPRLNIRGRTGFWLTLVARPRQTILGLGGRRLLPRRIVGARPRIPPLIGRRLESLRQAGR